MPDYSKWEKFEAVYLNDVRLTIEKHNTKDKSLVIIKVYSKPVTYFCKIKGRVNDIEEATKLTEAEAIKIQKKILQKSEII